MDYCLVDSGYAHLLKSCSTLSPDPLNLSDHLPLRVSLDVSTTKFTTPKSPALNWQQAVKEGSVQGFEENVSCFLSEILRRPAPLSMDELHNEIPYSSKFSWHKNLVKCSKLAKVLIFVVKIS